MKLLIAALIIISAKIIFAQNSDALRNSLTATEFSFAEFTGEQGIRDGFLKFIADDGILFRPGPVNGKEFLLASKKSPGYLTWYPVNAEISKNRDLGFTTGPWEYRKDKDSASIAFGNFCTVWQLQKDGNWKFVIDIGSSNGKPEIEPDPLYYNKSMISDFKPEKLASDNVDELIAIDKEISNQLNEKGIEQSFIPFVNNSSRFLRNDSFPIIGVDNVAKYLNEQKGTYEFSPIAGKISSSNDFGFTYGLVTVTDKENKTQKFNYMHIWKKGLSGWKLAVDVIDELP